MFNTACLKWLAVIAIHNATGPHLRPFTRAWQMIFNFLSSAYHIVILAHTFGIMSRFKCRIVGCDAYICTMRSAILQKLISNLKLNVIYCHIFYEILKSRRAHCILPAHTVSDTSYGAAAAAHILKAKIVFAHQTYKNVGNCCVIGT